MKRIGLLFTVASLMSFAVPVYAASEAAITLNIPVNANPATGGGNRFVADDFAPGKAPISVNAAP